MARSEDIKWRDGWKQFDPDSIFEDAMKGKNLVLTEAQYAKVKQLYIDYIHANTSGIRRNDTPMMEAAIKRGLFSCISSSVPYPCSLDNRCSQFGFRTRTLEAQRPNIDILASGTIQALNSTLNGNGIIATGLNYTPNKDSNEIYVGIGEGGMELPRTNSEQFNNVSLGVMISSIAILILCIIGIIIATSDRILEPAPPQPVVMDGAIVNI